MQELILFKKEKIHNTVAVQSAASNQSMELETKHLLADLTGNIRLQSACEDLVYDAVTVVGVVGLLPIIITWRNANTD